MNDPFTVTVLVLIELGIISGILRYLARYDRSLGTLITIVFSVGAVLVAEYLAHAPERGGAHFFIIMGYWCVWMASYVATLMVIARLR